MNVFIGCAGWSVPSAYAEVFAQAGSHLQRYAARLGAVEINSSFYRPHKPQTYARWAASVPDHFRFSVKMPRAITHEQRLHASDALLDAFLEQCGELGERLGCLLVQLPPSLRYEPQVARRFFEAVRRRHTGPLALEPRHASWQCAGPLLTDLQIAQVAASPARFESDAQPGGWPGLIYWRLHGEPRIYYSDYAEAYLQRLAAQLRASRAANVPTWCIFDNTAGGAALGNALALQERLDMSR